MANWKELGVVPDSEDEGWGSEDSQPSLTPSAKTSHAPPKPSHPQTDLRNDAVWDFPESPESPRSANHILNKPSNPTSEPQSTNFENRGQAALQLLGSRLSQPGDHGNRSDPARGSPDPLADSTEGALTSHMSPSRRDDISPSFVQITAPSANPFPGSSLDEPPNTRPRQFGPEKKNELGLPKDSRGHGLPISTQPEFPARGHRSLRPRKPIQEHPYLLENAQYSKLVKSHGVKPVRISAEERDALRRRNEEDSQDHEYSVEESQTVSGGPDGELQSRQNKARRGPLDDELDELALPQSPRTSSPQRHLRASSEQSPGEQTNATSISDDEEFPDIRDLTGTQMKKTSRLSKRRLPPAPSTSRKFPWKKPTISRRASPLQNQKDIWDLPPSLSPSDQIARLGTLFSPDVSPLRLSLSASTRRSTSPLRMSPAFSSAAAPEAVDLTHLTSETEQEDDKDQDTDGSDPQSDSELIRKTGRRIRGVLPASWLRLDQQSRKETAPSALRRRSPPRSPEKPRLGLATKKLGTSRPSVSSRSFLEELNDESDDHDDDGRHSSAQPGDDLDRLPVDDNGLVNFDDAGSVVVEDSVDWMLPGQKRHRSPMEGPPRKRKKLKQKVFRGEARQHYRQQKITASVRSLDSSTATNSKKGRRAAGPLHRPISPPALSIVDFVGPGAPKFIRVAARAASRRDNMGRSKPTNKSIHFGNRSDNIDALSVLTAWRTGRIKTSKPVSGPIQRTPFTARRPLRSLSANTRHQSQPSVRLSFAQPQKVTRQVSMRMFLPTGDPEKQSDGLLAEPAESRRTKVHDRRGESGYRPAQLEADVPEDLAARKKMLDLVFRRNRKEVLAPTFRLQRPTPDQEVARPRPPGTPAPRRGSEVDVLESEPLAAVTNKTRAPRLRKLVPPRRLDLEAPQFKHTNDPLPFFDAPADEEAVGATRQGQNRISGLGPFGTHYTQHFDIFPLHAATFFHQTTVIGNGTLRKAMSLEVSETIGCARPPMSFQFSGHTFSWRWWTDTTSSELGLVFDLLAEKLEGSSASESFTDGQEAITCVDHILGFMLDSVSVDKESSFSPFVQRSSELLLGFMDQTRPLISAQCCQRTLLQMNARLLICALILLRLCQGSTAGTANEFQHVEDLLKRLAKVVIGQLVEIGLSEVRETYDELQRLASRERGIRNDAVALTCWVIVIKVLASAQMPRAGFWDLTGSAIAGYLHEASDAQVLEASWRDMFTLLPLGEFDDSGILSKGMRYVAPLQGWALPQKLLKVVFESYQSNQRQSPSFNDYCRALLGRCHYLLEQWGWHKCVGIVGTLFDFFGNQNLSHLRNEEVYRSPRFLEELCDGPCLSIEPEDRCFHIFLKILAVAIQKMRQHGLSNDIRNLVARCLPNHNRQYSKEQTIHSHDLASLRNHHDLLCTLFWAVPPEDRRPVDLLEKLVLPASSHKEACLINLRAWSQLARFVVSSGGSIRDFRPFMSWQNNVFQQILNQYLSAAADVQHQFMSLAKEDRRDIQQRFLDSVVAANQAAAKDVLYCSVAASLDVMKHCPSLTSTIFAFNVNQTNKVFSKLVPADKESDWAILRACFDTIDLFVKRAEDLWNKLRESSTDAIPSNGNREFEDAVEFLDDKIVQSFFAAVRRTMLSPATGAAPQHAPKSATIEKSISLCARIASLFVDGGKTPLRLFFTTGKYGLFEALPHDLSLTERRFLPLFVATLLKNHIFNFSVIGCTHFDIWMLSLVKPYPALGYENHLAEILKTLDMSFMKGATTNLGAVPDYNKNRDFFASGISYMRKDIRKAEVVVRKSLRAKYEKLLRSVMQQMKADIKSLKLDSVEHRHYINFVREITGLIKSHGADICTVDPFYYQVSAEYSPAKEDPQLHTAGILAYGLRLGEGEMMAIPQLFHYLYNHFKSSLSKGQLDAESKIIENGLKDDNILAFVIGRMLPAITRASTQCPDIWPLLGVYSKSLRNVLERSALPREIPETQIDDVLVLLGAFLSWVQNLAESSSDITGMTPVQAHILTELMAVCNALQPTLMCWLMQPSVDRTKRMWKCIKEITLVAEHAAAVLSERAARGQTAVHDVRVTALLGPARGRSSLVAQPDSHVNSFAQNLTREVQHSWDVRPGIISVRVATTSSAQHGTQSLQGVKNDLDTRVGLLSELLSGLTAWVDEMGGNDKGSHASKRRRLRAKGLQGSLAL